MKRDRSPSAVLLKYFALRAELESVPSRTGAQIEGLQNQVAPEGEGRAAKLVEYGDLIYLIKDLNPQERHLCELRYGQLGDSDKLTVEQCRAAMVQPPSVEIAQRIASVSELEDLERWTAETLIPGKEGAVQGNSNLRWVRGPRARFPSYEEIGEAMHLTREQVKNGIQKALAKIGTAIRLRLLMTDIESKYE